MKNNVHHRLREGPSSRPQNPCVCSRQEPSPDCHRENRLSCCHRQEPIRCSSSHRIYHRNHLPSSCSNAPDPWRRPRKPSHRIDQGQRPSRRPRSAYSEYRNNSRPTSQPSRTKGGPRLSDQDKTSGSDRSCLPS